jgi:hypothetical protein
VDRHKHFAETAVSRYYEDGDSRFLGNVGNGVITAVIASYLTF